MVSLSDFLHGVQLNAHRVTQYEWGADGSKVTGEHEEVRYENGQKVTYIIKERPCDCIGLITGGLELAGGKWTGTHGTNWTARNAIDNLHYISNADELYLGKIVFKARELGESGYDLPSTYSDSLDQRDYYHVGVVTGVSPLEITHCTSVDGGIKRDSSLGAWHYGGGLKYVNYGSSEETEKDTTDEEFDSASLAKVYAPTGNTVNLRKEPSLNSKVLIAVPIGAYVHIAGYDETYEWNKVECLGTVGYMMTKFLIPDISDEEPAYNEETKPNDEVIGVLKNICLYLEKAVEELEKITAVW